MAYVYFHLGNVLACRGEARSADTPEKLTLGPSPQHTPSVSFSSFCRVLSCSGPWIKPRPLYGILPCSNRNIAYPANATSFDLACIIRCMLVAHTHKGTVEEWFIVTLLRFWDFDGIMITSSFQWFHISVLLCTASHTRTHTHEKKNPRACCKCTAGFPWCLRNVVVERHTDSYNSPSNRCLGFGGNHLMCLMCLMCLCWQCVWRWIATLPCNKPI